VKITDLFEGTDQPHDTAQRSVFDQLARPESFRLVQAFSRIDRPNIRRNETICALSEKRYINFSVTLWVLSRDASSPRNGFLNLQRDRVTLVRSKTCWKKPRLISKKNGRD
jgi:hypothetical protein